MKKLRNELSDSAIDDLKEMIHRSEYEVLEIRSKATMERAKRTREGIDIRMLFSRPTTQNNVQKTDELFQNTPKETLQQRAERVCRNPGAGGFLIGNALGAIGDKAGNMSDAQLADAINEEI